MSPIKSAIVGAMLAVACQGAPTAIFTDGFGVHQPQSGIASDVTIDTVGEIVGRLLGLTSSNIYLPEGDVLNRPKVCVVVAVDGATGNDMGDDFLDGLANRVPRISLSNDISQLTFGEKTQDMLEVDSKYLPQWLSHEFAGSKYLESNVCNLDVTECFQKESKKIVNLLKKNTQAVHDNAPDLIVLPLSASITTTSVEQQLNKLSKPLGEFLNEVNALYNGRAAYQVVLMGNSIPESASRRMLADTNGSSTNEVEVFDTTQYLLVSWTVVCMAIGVYAILCCIEWSEDLDPILNAALGRDDAKRD